MQKWRYFAKNKGFHCERSHLLLFFVLVIIYHRSAHKMPLFVILVFQLPVVGPLALYDRFYPLVCLKKADNVVIDLNKIERTANRGIW